MVVLAQLALAAAFAGPAAAQLFGLSPKAILPLIKTLPPALMTPAMTEMFNKQVNGKYGKTTDASNTIPSRQEMASEYATQSPGTKAVKIRYGPYLVPSMGKKNGLDQPGSLWNYPDKVVDKPCETCIVTGIKAGLEYSNGTNANIDSGAWLHHFVLFNQGPGRVDATCEKNARSLPHLAIGSNAKSSERVFASGNERVALYTNAGAGSSKPAGYHMKPTDKFAMLIDFMNEGMEDKLLYLTITYDYVDGHPSGWDNVRPLWFDIDQCGFSEVKPKQESGKFTINDPTPWTSTVDGEILGWFGHLHDGGVSVTMDLDGKTECVSSASYGGSPGFVQKMSMGPAGSATEHISNMSMCGGSADSKNTMMKKGQVWKIKADYDYGKHNGMKEEDGEQSEIMGIAFMYVRQPQ